ncbi:MAG TPA: S9 family peptidase [Pirellulales bacterium]|jgi:dipeptidyl aminopeptidase/acylaminoacyl peptidase|nr:S9 family peptidase [Pirellulales bacterium]
MKCRGWWLMLAAIAFAAAQSGCFKSTNETAESEPAPTVPSASTGPSLAGQFPTVPSRPNEPLPSVVPGTLNSSPSAATEPAPPAPEPVEPEPPPKPKIVEAQMPEGKTLPAYLKGVPTIAREVFFGNPDKAAARLSHDARYLSYLAPVHGVLNVWVGPVDNPAAARPVTHDKKRGIQSYFWAYTNKHIVYRQDSDGDENWHVYAVDLDSGKTKDLTPLENVAAQIEEVSYKYLDEIVVGLNDRDSKVHDLYRIVLRTGERTLLERNEQDFDGYVVDEDFRVRFASRYLPDGGRAIMEPDGLGGWKPFLRIPAADDLTTGVVGFDKTGRVAYLMDSRDRDTAALYSLDLRNGEKKLIAANDKSDVGSVLTHPTENTIEAVSFTYEREHWDVIDPTVAEDFKYLRSVDEGDIQIPSRSLDDKQWIVAFLKDDGPIRYYRYQREPRDAKFLFTNRKSLEGLPLVKMHPLLIKARDSLELVCYLSLPKGADPQNKGRPSVPLPMVLDVHGGPWARDDWGYNAQHQLLANRGYAVLSVNFRGSTGFGKEFLNAANKQWYGTMHDDLIDAVEYCVKEKIADPKRVAIMGGSYGGFATLVGMTKTPDTFACGIDIVGPSNILTLLATIPPYWQPAIQMFRERVGDNTTEEGRKFLEECSPLTHVANIKKPLLIGQGANDPRVKQSEADQIVQAMQEKKIPVTYVLYPDEGHGFARPANRLSFNAVSEGFLAENLGGRFQAIGDDFEGSTITVSVGADDVPGLEAALKKHDEAK